MIVFICGVPSAQMSQPRIVSTCPSSRIRGRVVPGLHRMQKFPSGYAFQSSSTRREIMYIIAVSQCTPTNTNKSDETFKSQSQQLHAFRFKPPAIPLKTAVCVHGLQAGYTFSKLHSRRHHTRVSQTPSNLSRADDP